MAAIVFGGAVHMLIQAQMLAFELIKSSSETTPPPPTTHPPLSDANGAFACRHASAVQTGHG